MVRPSLAQVVHDPVEGLLHQRVEAFGRLVQHRQVRVVLEGLDHAQLLAHAARVVAHLALQDGGGHLQPLAQRLAAHRRPSLQVVEVVKRIFAAERVVERDAAGQVPHPPPNGDRVGHDVHAEHGGAALGRVQVAQQGADGGRLAGAVRPQEAEDLAGLDLQVQADQGLDAAVVLAQPLGVDRGLRHLGSLAFHVLRNLLRGLLAGRPIQRGREDSQVAGRRTKRTSSRPIGFVRRDAQVLRHGGDRNGRMPPRPDTRRSPC